MKNIDLSIIIVSYNTKKLLEKCLETIHTSLQKAPFGYEIIVVDNGSTDGSIELVRKYTTIQHILNKDNVGFGKANNQGVEQALGKTILFLNSDIEVKDQAVEKLYTFFKSLPRDSIVGGKLYNRDGSPQPSCGPAYTLWNIFVALFLKGDYTGLTRYSPQTIKQVDWVMGACFMMSKSYFTQVGGFDEGIFMYMEEIDFEHRAQKRGCKIYFYPEAEFVHVGAASSAGRANPIHNVFKGLLYFYKKHYSLGKNIILRTLLVLKSLMAIGLFTLMGKKYDREIYQKALRLVI